MAARSTSYGYGGAVSSVDAKASRIGLEVLRKGGNAADAAVATAAALGVTEPYSAGIGGGGYFVYFDARPARSARSTAARRRRPACRPTRSSTPRRPAVPSPPSSSRRASRSACPAPSRRGRRRSTGSAPGPSPMLAPSIVLAAQGLRGRRHVPQQTLDNQARFAAFPDTAKLFLPGGDAPEVGTLPQPRARRDPAPIALRGTDAFYQGALADEIADVVQHPRKDPASTLPAPAGSMTAEDIAAYRVMSRRRRKLTTAASTSTAWRRRRPAARRSARR